MEIGLIIVGDEILSGRRSDKHFANVVSLLAERGLRLSWCQILADDVSQLTRAYRNALESGDIVFSCGGIGGTPDDLTRYAVAQASERALIPHAEGLNILRQQFKSSEITLARQRMIEFPTGARLIPNPINQVPGFSIDCIHCVPGFPKMATPMIKWVLENEYAHLENKPQLEHAVRISGARESDLIPLMEFILEQCPEVKVFSLPRLKKKECWVDLGVKGGNYESVDYAFQLLVKGLEEIDLHWQSIE
ncbi:MAG: competence/damage-inducible protein A [Thiotrichales bacterium]|nr:competence/damage-inducible protein A [Thiotrichales bacterium]